jgi:hypothetical protein
MSFLREEFTAEMAVAASRLRAQGYTDTTIVHTDRVPNVVIAGRLVLNYALLSLGPNL